MKDCLHNLVSVQLNASSDQKEATLKMLQTSITNILVQKLTTIPKHKFMMKIVARISACCTLITSTAN